MINPRKTPVSDYDRLMRAVDGSLISWTAYAPYVDAFRRRLRESASVSITDAPPDVITMNSRFIVKNNAGEFLSYTLVYPEHASPSEVMVSVLSPMGMALHGACVGDRVAWTTDDGTYTAVVLKLLYQPEAAGEHQL